MTKRVGCKFLLSPYWTINTGTQWSVCVVPFDDIQLVHFGLFTRYEKKRGRGLANVMLPQFSYYKKVNYWVLSKCTGSATDHEKTISLKTQTYWVAQRYESRANENHWTNLNYKYMRKLNSEKERREKMIKLVTIIGLIAICLSAYKCAETQGKQNNEVNKDTPSEGG